MKQLRWIIIVGLIAIGAVGCSTGQKDAEADKTISIAMPPWTTSPPPTYVAKVMLEDVLGLKVNIEEVDVGIAFQALVTKDIDLLVDGWMPHLHANYFETHGDNLDVLGDPLYTGTELGWGVPSYVTIDSVTQLNDHIDEFGGRVIGIDPGAGMMQVTEEIIETYELDYELVEGSEFAMLATVADAIRAEEWVVFIAWRPHFMFTQHDLKILDEPQGLWSEDHVVKVSRLDFREDFPEAARLLANWEMQLDDIEMMINEIEIENRQPEEVAREWVEANRDAIEEWRKAE